MDTENKFTKLENRTTEFAKNILRLCKKLPHGPEERVLISQVVRSAGSIGANYREANETVGDKDFGYRMRIARKEAKETEHWLRLIEVIAPDKTQEIASLINETIEFRKIFSAILGKCK